jgi:hypothetical protein
MRLMSPGKRQLLVVFISESVLKPVDPEFSDWAARRPCMARKKARP